VVVISVLERTAIMVCTFFGKHLLRFSFLLFVREGSMTLLFQRDVGGLQILLPGSPDGSTPATWLDAPVVDDTVLVNIGDAFDFWTGGKFKSTQHRVSLPRNAVEAGPRYSIAYFL